MSAFLAILKRELHLALRQRSDSLVAVLFFVLTAVLFPLGIGPEPELLARIAPGVIWVTALLASLLSLERLFQGDYEDGSLDLLVLTPAALELTVLAKCLAHWLTTGLPLALAAPLVALGYALPAQALGGVLLALLLGTPTLTLVGAVGAALVLGARRGGVLLSLLVLPLYVPVLIFGAAAVEAALGGYGAGPAFTVLAALFIAALSLSPWAIAAALRQAAGG